MNIFNRLFTKGNVKAFLLVFMCMFLLASCSKAIENKNQDNLAGQNINSPLPEASDNPNDTIIDENTESIENAENNENTQNIENTQNNENTENNQNTKNTENTKSTENTEITDVGQAKEAQLVMKIFVNLGMDDYYKVLDLNDNTVTYSYYSYENKDTPELDQKTVPFDEIMEIEHGVRKYLFFMYLDDGKKEVQLDMSKDFVDQVENNSDFRARLGKALNKPFDQNLVNSTISSSDIN